MLRHNILKNSFFKNVLKVSTGTFLAQILMLAGMPIITRLYSKEVIGMYALFTSTIGITTVFVTLAYDNAIVLPKKEEDANALLKITIIISLVLSLCVLLFLQIPLSFFSDYKKIAIFIALGTFFQVLVNSLGYLKVRHNLFNQLSVSKVIRNLALLVCQIGLFYLTNFYGLLFGFIIASLITMLYLMYKDKAIINALFKDQDKLLLQKNLKDYDQYPKYFCWSNFIFALSSGLSVLIFNEFFSLDQIAIYSIAYSIIIQPAGLISSSIRPVLLSKFAQKQRANDSILNIYNKIFLILLLAGATLSLLMFFVLPELVILIFGKDWIESATLTVMLIPIFVWYFISIPSSIASKVYPFQKYSLFYTIISLIFKIGSIFVSIKLDLQFNNVVLMYALATFASDLFNHLIISQKIKKYEVKI